MASLRTSGMTVPAITTSEMLGGLPSQLSGGRRTDRPNRRTTIRMAATGTLLKAPTTVGAKIRATTTKPTTTGQLRMQRGTTQEAVSRGHIEVTRPSDQRVIIGVQILIRQQRGNPTISRRAQRAPTLCPTMSAGTLMLTSGHRTKGQLSQAVATSCLDLGSRHQRHQPQLQARNGEIQQQRSIQMVNRTFGKARIDIIVRV